MSPHEASERISCGLRVVVKRGLRNIVFSLAVAVGLTGCASNEGQKTEPRGDASRARTETATPSPDARQSSPSDASGVDAFPKKSELTRKERAAWREILKWSEDCEESFAGTHDAQDSGFAGLEFYELSDKQYLVEVACAAGAYQGAQVYVHLDESKSPPVINPLTFNNYVAADEDKLEQEETPELWGTPTFDAGTKQLTVLNKYRGPGDCGALATYGFEGGTPKLLEFRAKTRCDGRGAENPKLWKKIALP